MEKRAKEEIAESATKKAASAIAVAGDPSLIKEIAELTVQKMIAWYGLDTIRFFPNNQTALSNAAHRVLDSLRMEHTQTRLDQIVGTFHKCLNDGFFDIPVIKTDYRGHLPAEKNDNGDEETEDVQQVSTE